MNDVGFPDFAPPYFFNATSLPHSNLDRVSARYEAQAVTPWLANLSLTAHYQRTERLLQNLLPVQFPAPTPVAFFPISVFRLDILSETEQRVWTPGVDLQAVFVPASNHVLTTGPDVLSRSQQRRPHDHDDDVDGRPGGARRSAVPRRSCFPSPVQLGPPSVAHPVRVPDASLRDVAVFAQDEWRLRPNAVARGRPARRLLQRDDRGHARLRRGVGRGRRAAARSIRRRCPDPERRDLRAEGADRRHRPRRQRRRAASARSSASAAAIAIPNLEEMLFAGPATAGSIAPNVKLKPETGQQLRRRRQVQLPARLGRRVRLRQPVQELRRPGPDDGDHAGRPAGAGHQLRRRPHPRPRAVGRRAARARAGRADAERVRRVHARHDHRRASTRWTAARSTARRPTTSRRSRCSPRLGSPSRAAAGGRSTACGRRPTSRG